MFLAIKEKSQEHVDRKKEAPPEKRAFLAGPESGEFVKAGKSAIAMFGDVGKREIVGEKEEFKRSYGGEDQEEDGHAGVLSAAGEQRAASEDSDQSGDEGVDSDEKGEQESKRAKNIQRVHPFMTKSTGRARRCGRPVVGLTRLHSGRGTAGSARRGLVFGGALGLNLLGGEMAVGHQAALDEGLGPVFKRIGQRIAANIGNGKLFALFDKYEIDAVGEVLNGAVLNIAGDAHALARSGGRKRRKLGDRVVIGLALCIADVGEQRQRDDDDR